MNKCEVYRTMHHYQWLLPFILGWSMSTARPSDSLQACYGRLNGALERIKMPPFPRVVLKGQRDALQLKIACLTFVRRLEQVRERKYRMT